MANDNRSPFHSLKRRAVRSQHRAEAQLRRLKKFTRRVATARDQDQDRGGSWGYLTSPALD
jgi:hypothetical protein